MNVLLLRDPFTDEGTFGQMTGMSFTFDTLELPWRDLDGNGIGDPQKSCITEGLYECVWHTSPSKGECYHVTNVTGRSHILIHSANFAGDVDKDWQAQLLGCIALGKNAGVMPNQNGRAQRAILQSRAAMNEFHLLMAKQPFRLEVRWKNSQNASGTGSGAPTSASVGAG